MYIIPHFYRKIKRINYFNSLLKTEKTEKAAATQVTAAKENNINIDLTTDDWNISSFCGII